MKIKILDKNNSAVKFAFFSAIGSEYYKIDQITEAAYKEDAAYGRDYDIIFTVNGVELNFQNFINRLCDSYDTQVEDAAKRLITNKFATLNNRLDELSNNLNNNINEINLDIDDMFKAIKKNVRNIFE